MAIKLVEIPAVMAAYVVDDDTDLLDDLFNQGYTVKAQYTVTIAGLQEGARVVMILHKPYNGNDQ